MGNTIIGVLIMVFLTNALAVLGVSHLWQEAVFGLVIIFAALMEKASKADCLAADVSLIGAKRPVAFLEIHSISAQNNKGVRNEEIDYCCLLPPIAALVGCKAEKTPAAEPGAGGDRSSCETGSCGTGRARSSGT